MSLSELDKAGHCPVPDRKAALLGIMEDFLRLDAACGAQNYLDEILALAARLLPRWNPAGWQAHLDCLRHNEIFGWAKRVDRAHPAFVTIVANGLICQQSFLADVPRPDLRAADMGQGMHGFQTWLDPTLWDVKYRLVTLEDENAEKIIAMRLFWAN